MSKSQDFVGLTNFDGKVFWWHKSFPGFFIILIQYIVHSSHRISADTFTEMSAEKFKGTVCLVISLKRPCARQRSDKSRCLVKSLGPGCNKSCNKCRVPEVVRWAREQWNEFLWPSQVDSLAAVRPSPNYSKLDYNSKLMKAVQLLKWENLIFLSNLMLQMTDPDKENVQVPSTSYY